MKKTSECCNAEIEIIERGQYVDDPSRGWIEVECQQCGSIYFLELENVE